MEGGAPWVLLEIFQRKAHFMTSHWIDLLAPSHFPLGQPPIVSDRSIYPDGQDSHS
jgi:hypothetical protein